MRKQLIIITILFSLILLSGFVIANNNCIPNKNTNEFYGIVYYNNMPLTGGNHTLIAMIGDSIVGAQKIKSDGSYDIDVSPCPEINSGKINFFVGDTEAKENGDYEYDDSAPILIPLDLNLKKYPNAVCGNGETNKGEECDDENLINGDGCSINCEVELGYNCKGAPSVCTLAPYCGDGIVNGGETCSSCPADAGTCPDDNNRGGGGGGGGGGSITIVKTLPATNGTSTNSSQSGSSSTGNLTEQDNSQEVSPSFITGAVTGVTGFVKSGAGIAVIIIIALGAGIIIFRNRKK